MMDETLHHAPASAQNPATVTRSWQVASRIVASRPELSVSWADWYDGPDHLVVHDGAFGSALHFDRDDGPTWESGTAPDRDLRWRDVQDIDAPNAFAPINWTAHWGQPVNDAGLTAKPAIYTLIGHILQTRADERRWTATPAKLVHPTDASADAPDSAFSLCSEFPTLESTVNWYTSLINAHYRRASGAGRLAVWHEPLWLLAMNGEPRLVLDEAGHVHMTSSSLAEALAMLAAAADMGGIEDPWHLDVLEALARVRGSFASLAALLRRGPVETVQAVKPDHNTTQPSGRRLLTQSERDEAGWSLPPITTRIVILTGPGISTESGSATSRDFTERWKNHDIGEIASLEAFARDPAFVHEFYDMLRRTAFAAEPNAAHYALAELGWRLGGDVMIVTVNLDDLHEQAGNHDVIHMHGEVKSAWCTACGMRWNWGTDLGDETPCPGCQHTGMRPDVVWFGEPVYQLADINAAVDSCELLVVIGISGAVDPAAALAARAKAHGAWTVLLNLEDDREGWRFDEVRLGPAASIVPAWVDDELEKRKDQNA